MSQADAFQNAMRQQQMYNLADSPAWRDAFGC